MLASLLSGTSSCTDATHTCRQGAAVQYKEQSRHTHEHEQGNLVPPLATKSGDATLSATDHAACRPTFMACIAARQTILHHAQKKKQLHRAHATTLQRTAGYRKVATD
jgi:hypothetical protein